MYNLTGTIKAVKDTVQVTDSFKKREIVVTVKDGDYDQHVQLELIQDDVDKANGLTAGDKVEVSFNLRGREWTSPQGEVKYFNTLNAWKIETVTNSTEKEILEDGVVNSTDTDLPF